MLNVTERAKHQLKEILATKVDDPRAGLRLHANGAEDFDLTIDIEEPGDKVIKYKGLKVLLIKEELVDSLNGITIDVEDTPEGPKLTVIKKPADK